MMTRTTQSAKEQIAAAVSQFMDDESGATAVEYALLASLIGVAIIFATQNLGQRITQIFDNIRTNLRTT